MSKSRLDLDPHTTSAPIRSAALPIDDLKSESDLVSDAVEFHIDSASEELEQQELSASKSDSENRLRSR